MSMQPSEAEFQHAVRQLAAWQGWRSWHFSDSRRVGPRGRLVGDAGAAGFPDLTMVHPEYGIVFAELKSVKGRLRPAQRESLDQLLAAAPDGVRVWVWRPADWEPVIMPLLTAGTGPKSGGW